MTDKVGAADMGPAFGTRSAKSNGKVYGSAYNYTGAPVDFVDSLIAKVWADEVRRVDISRDLYRRKAPRTTARHTTP
jgi:hypothetical protein